MSCKWYAESKKCVFAAKADAPLSCDGQSCGMVQLNKLMNLVSSTPAQAAQVLNIVNRMFCLSIRPGVLCYDMFPEAFTSKDGYSIIETKMASQQGMNDICMDKDRKQCWMQLWMGQTDIARQALVANYQYCVNPTGMTSGPTGQNQGPSQGPSGPSQGPSGPNQGPSGPNQGPQGPNQGPQGPNQGPLGPNGTKPINGTNSTNTTTNSSKSRQNAAPATTVAGSNDAQRAQVIQKCTAMYMDSLKGITSASNQIGSFCTTADQKPDSGKYCMFFYSSRLRNDSCIGAIFSSKNPVCTSECDKRMRNLTVEMGCCGSIINDIANPQIDEKQAMAQIANSSDKSGGNNQPTGPAPTNPMPTNQSQEQPRNASTTNGTGNAPLVNPKNMFANLSLCASFNNTAELNRLVDKCGGLRPGQAPPKKSLRLNLNWNEISKNPILKTKFEATITSDVATSAGCDPAALVNGTLSEDSTRQVTANATSRRQSSTASATKFDFYVTSTSPDDTDALSSTIDSKAASNSIALTSTQSTVASDCTACADQSSSSGGLFGGAFSTSSFLGASSTVATAAVVFVSALLVLVH
jgi:hypothetical protein